MLLGMVERKMPIDCVLFCDTGIEFPQMYEHIRKVEEAVGIPITRVKSEQSYEYLMLKCPIERKDNSLSTKQGGNSSNGYSWAGPKMRWCTSRLKDAPREKFLKPLREKYDVREFVGIAADEQYRLERKRNKSANHVHPLVDWNMTEAECLNYCYEKGFDWDGLYEHFHILMLNQAASDREQLARILKIPDAMMKFVTGAPAGSGLIYCGLNGSLPFKDDFPTDTKLYKLMTTKFGE